MRAGDQKLKYNLEWPYDYDYDYDYDVGEACTPTTKHKYSHKNTCL